MREDKRAMMLEVRDLGRMPYARALAIQREINLAVSEGRYTGGGSLGDASSGGNTSGGDTSGGGGGCLLLVEHDPVITVTHRQGAWDNLLAPVEQLEQMGIAVEITDRGGDITYHGPGQLVAYPILKLNPLGLNLGSYMRLLEQVVIDVLAGFSITGQRDPDATGVWVRIGDQGTGIGDQGSGTEGQQNVRPIIASDDTRYPKPDTRLAKLCAMGVRVRKNTTMHGLALNITTNLDHFKTIDPCGLGGRPVTSLNELLGENTPTIEEVKKRLVDTMQAVINTRVMERRG